MTIWQCSKCNELFERHDFGAWKLDAIHAFGLCGGELVYIGEL